MLVINGRSVLNLVQIFKYLEIRLLNLTSPRLLVRFIRANTILQHSLPQFLIAKSLWVLLPEGVYRLFVIEQISVVVFEFSQTLLVRLIPSLLLEIPQIHKVLPRVPMS